MSQEPKGRIGDYEILGVLGSGGMGKVYKVRNTITDRVEAMKVLLPDLAEHPEVAERFQQEIRVLAGLSHPHIASLYTAFSVGRELVMIMEYVEGTTLSDRLSKGPLPAEEALSYVDQALDALSYAHGKQVIHRDIKPANMILTPAGTLKLMDFGIARVGKDPTLTRTGTTLGSLHYMSPEQVKRQPIDERSDLYSLGVSLYEMVTGQRPFQADSEFGLMEAHVQQIPVPPAAILSSLPAWLNELILKSIAKDPTDRFQSANAFRSALAELRASIPAGRLEMSCFNPPREQSFVREVRDAVEADAVVTRASSWWSRGAYMALGSLVVLAVLVWAGISVPRRAKVRAGAGSDAPKPLTTVEDHPGTGAPGSSGAPAVGTSTPDKTSTAASGSGSAGVVSSGANSSVGSGGTVSQPADRSKPTDHLASGSVKPAVPAALTTRLGQHDEELEQRRDSLSARAVAINQQLDVLQLQQTAQGWGLRGDMAAAQEMMKTHLAEAEKAYQAGDVEHARKYLDQAAEQIVKLEDFLGIHHD